MISEKISFLGNSKEMDYNAETHTYYTKLYTLLFFPEYEKHWSDTVTRVANHP